MAQASLQQTSVKFVLPLGPEKRENIEVELSQKLASGKHVSGGIFLTSTFNNFCYIRCDGDTEVPLRDQFQLLRSQDKDLGTKRRETRTIYFVQANRGVDARLFVRVLEGCDQVQIDGAVQYLNQRLAGPNNTFPGVCEQYDELIPFCRDILYPGFRYFTRRKRLSPWMWQPIKYPTTGSTVTLSDVIHNGCDKTAVEVQAPIQNYRWPEVTLVRRTDTNTVHTLDELSKVCPEDAIMADNMRECPADSTNPPTEPVPLHAPDMVLGDTSGNTVDNVETKDAESKDQSPNNSEAKAEAKAQEQVSHNKSKTSDEGDSDQIEEINMESEDAKSCANSIDNDSDDDKVANNEGSKENSPKNVDNQDENPGELEQTKQSDAAVDNELPDYNDEEEEILSGYMDSNRKSTATKSDDRPVTLRRLHMALPKSKSAIPDGLKKRLPFSMLVLNIRKLETEYNESVGIDTDLPEIDEGKTLNQREVKRELKHLLELMVKRDQWESEMRVSQAKEIVEKKSKKLTKAQKKLEAEKMERREQQRLAAKEKLADGIPDNLKDVAVELGPSNRGLSGFGFYRRQGEQIRENERRKKERDELHKLANMDVQRDDSIASSTGSVKPLSRVLLKQTSKSAKAQAKASTKARDKKETKAPRLSNDQLLQELDDIGEILDIAKGMNEPEPQPTTSKDLKKKSMDDSVFAVPQLPKGYVKADTLKLMKAMYVQQSQLITSNDKRFDQFSKQLKSLDDRQKRTEAILEQTGDSFGKMQKAFFDYDLQANQELCDAESEFLAYLPLNQLGVRADFVFTDPSCAKTIVKRIVHNLQKEGTKRQTFSNLINESARVCFSHSLRAHMHIVKRQWKDSVGWWKVKCPESFRKMVEKYVIPHGAKFNLKESREGWRTILYTHFKNTGDTYIQSLCAGTKSQTEYITKRHQVRLRLQEQHYNEDVEGRELRIPSLADELSNYAKHSDRFDDAAEMDWTEKSQKNRGMTEQEEEEEEQEEKVPPLPNLTALHNMAQRLKKAIDASVNAGKEQKRKIAVDNLVSAEARQDSSADEEDSPPKKKKAKVAVDNMKKKKAKKAKVIVSSSSSSSSSTSSSPSNSGSSDESSDSSEKEKEAFKANTSKFNLEATLNRTSSKAAASTPKKLPPPMGKPKAYASFLSHPPKKSKKASRKQK